MHEISVRDALPSDAEAIAEFANALAVITEGEAAPITADRIRQDLIGQSAYTLLLAERDGTAAGYALVMAAYETGHAAKGLYVSDLYVAEPARQSGVARALIAEVARRARAVGGRFLWLISDPEDLRANGFYDRIGATRHTKLCRAVIDADLDALAKG